MSFISDKGRLALTKVAEWLEAGAPHVDEKGIAKFSIDAGVENLEGCGTTCCIAGAVVQFDDPSFLKEGDARSWSFVYHDAVEILGISESDADALFFAAESGMDDEQVERSKHITPALAAKVIRHYLETGAVDWDI